MVGRGVAPSEAIEDLGSKGCWWAPQLLHLLTWATLSLRHLSNRTEHMWYIHMAGAFSCSVLGSEVSSSWSKFYLCFLQNRVPGQALSVSAPQFGQLQQDPLVGLEAYVMIQEMKCKHLATPHNPANGKCSRHFRFCCCH